MLAKALVSEVAAAFLLAKAAYALVEASDALVVAVAYEVYA